ncbi:MULTISPECIES: alpha/beta fold hydrolase [Myxococcus]|uniref:Alpha/beta hydrolase n=1 Tax=Myxococcus llanfairpwllgwyngyllgogerychwyrndrobwllllantysiliogogogochensis TaxID=2590453 RepID=A0A540X430_9BACT|nr:MULTISPECIES: alpha/beta hydrolase [Myxococcus]NTX06793.1 alpha/beta hydrolase [Myxococcus sp. CA040A]TQF16013.1 alpha/beta hydrolase [Myxococcus llanfairpwllgwyngyllgogerychwyrndrobwllllantysiliogogogochensis]
MKLRRKVLITVLVLLAGVLAASLRLDVSPQELEARYATAPSRFVEVDGLRIHYRDQGQGPTLLLLHGSNASLFTWEGWVRELSENYRVITLDLPGHGLTGPDARGRYTADAMVEVVEAFRARLGLEQFVLGGNSMGGSISWRYALLHPQRVTRLVLVDAAGFPRDTPAPLVFRLMRAPVVGEVLSLFSPRWVIDRNLRAVYGEPSRVTEALVEQYHALLLREGNRTATRERMRAGGDDARWKQLGELRMPTLVLWGAKDAWIPLEHGQRFARAIPGARLIVYPELGHVPMEEDAARTARELRGFLEASAPAPTGHGTL